MILIVEENASVCDYIHEVIESTFNIPIIDFHRKSEAIAFLKDRKEIRAVITTENSKSIEKGLVAIKSDSYRLPIIVLNKKIQEDKKNSYLLDYMKQAKNKNYNIRNILFNAEDIINQIYDVLKVNPTDEYNNIDINSNNYLRLRVAKFSEHEYWPFDVFISLSESKMIMLFKSGEQIDHDRLNRYQEKGLSYLLVPRNEYLEFLRSEKKRIMEMLKEKVHIPNFEIQGAEIPAIKFIHTTLNNVGISKHAVDITNAIIENILQNLNKRRDLRRFLKSYTNTDCYLSRHSLITGYIGVSIVTHFQWNEEYLGNGLLHAALLHDISFTNPEWARIDETAKIDRTKITQKQSDFMRKNLYESSDILKSILGICPEAERMVEDHHERPDGTGWPRGKSTTNIPVTSAIFNVAHEIAAQLAVEYSIDAIMAHCSGLFEKGAYLRAFSAFKNEIDYS